jgi:hypothetical protein
MPAAHSKQGSTLRAHTRISPNQAAQLAKSTSGLVTAGMPGGAFVRFEGERPGRLLFSIRSLGGHAELMSFCVYVRRDPAGFTALDTHIQGFKTAQQTYLFIPIGRKQLVGYSVYKTYARNLGSALQQVDPQSSCVLVERP